MSDSTTRHTILVVDDERSIREAIQGILEDEGFSIITTDSGEDALEMVKKIVPDLVLLDIWLPGIDGLETLTRMREISPDIGVIMISGHGTIETAVKATKLGALNFIEKPLSLHRLVIEVRQALKQQQLERENRQLRQAVRRHQPIIGNSKLIAEVRKLIEIAAPSNGRVLISGESGTGKELVAREIHYHSNRSHGPFVEVNCAAIPEDLIESELFGHEKGAFTNATYRKKGKFELAHNGTLFLDEVGDMSLKTQAKVLRVLEEGKIERVGGNHSIPVDVRVIAASNKNLLEEIANNRFREDLFYRLNVIPITVPALRNHPEDIQVLAEYYLDYFCKEYGKPLKKIEPDGLRLMESYPWPGNIRELKNEIERLVIMVPGTIIRKKYLRMELRRPQDTSDIDLNSIRKRDLKSAREEFERRFILKRLEDYRWNVTQTAESLEIERSNLHRKMKLLGISCAPESPENRNQK